MNQDEVWLLQEKYGGEKTAGFFADCERVTAGEPLAYVIGWVPFLGCKIYLDSHPLIPRPETEFWVEKAIANIEKDGDDASRPLQILDLCAGSGCIGVAVAKAIPNVQVTFAEIDQRHLPTIKKNLAENISDYSARSEYYHVRRSDLFADSDTQYDRILSNPPYIDPALDRTQDSVTAHEPHNALYGGKDGMELIERIIKEASHHLAAQGKLWLEHEPEQSVVVQELAEEHGFSVATHTDQFGVERYSVLVIQ